MEKKAWKKPRLIVIVNHEPEESVLKVCKEHVSVCNEANGKAWLQYGS